MDSPFVFEKSESIFADDFDRCGAEACAIAVFPIESFDAVTFALRPASVHAVQHLRPIAGLSPTGTRLDCEVAIRIVVGSIQKRQKFVFADVFFKLRGSGDGFLGQLFIVEFFGQRYAFNDVLAAIFQIKKCTELLFHSRSIFRNRASFVRIIPEIRSTHRFLKRLDFIF